MSTEGRYSTRSNTTVIIMPSRHGRLHAKIAESAVSISNRRIYHCACKLYCSTRLPSSRLPHIGTRRGSDLQQALLPNAITLYEDTRPAIDHLVLESVRVDVAFHRVILCSRLQPKHRDVQLLGLLEQPERYLSSRSRGKKRKEGGERGNEANLGIGDDAHGSFGGCR